MQLESLASADFIFHSDTNTLVCRGYWTISNIKDLNKKFNAHQAQLLDVITCDVSAIDGLDTAGALMLNKLLRAAHHLDPSAIGNGLKKQYRTLYKLVSLGLSKAGNVATPVRQNVFYYLGLWAVEKIVQIIHFVTFVGELIFMSIHSMLKPGSFSWRELIAVMEETGYKALAITALMSFLIGIVLAYQLAIQLRQYGANIFIVDTTGIAIVREFAPLITAVIMAGRTSTAFAALIGTMMVNEEVDALRTMGVQPMQRLVLPRIVALLITLPLLVVWSDVFGVMGSMVMAKSILNISYHAFLDRFDIAVSLTHYILGLIKTPVFALIIASVGCFQGLQVGLSAESVGQQTTKAAVQSIFLIIIFDALFSIVFSMMNL